MEIRKLTRYFVFSGSVFTTHSIFMANTNKCGSLFVGRSRLSDWRMQENVRRVLERRWWKISRRRLSEPTTTWFWGGWLRLLFFLLRILGTPTEETWTGVTSLPDYKSSFPKWTGGGLHKEVPTLCPEGLDLLEVTLLVWVDRLEAQLDHLPFLSTEIPDLWPSKADICQGCPQPSLLQGPRLVYPTRMQHLKGHLLAFLSHCKPITGSYS